VIPTKISKPGANLKAARLSAGLTIGELARRLDVTPASVVNVESGHREPSLERILRISEAIGCDPHSIDARLASR
jgi:transcriptional regulator with XRE-family HTH domain